ncbi:hypothetical protein DBR11_17355 [Pedobacter sp. HMWF019]|uniref:hypothetical protein n=1 Tax=Pedobacter sp. HMWF019 TaxID=2056856 RepID=UPI000D3D5BC1|nr:hypothetical protein [Pedobacter sp. HMWF019]PTS97372.1 hypothetical protein DBR11_17355 [Pedobacter sp. HMWF019]
MKKSFKAALMVVLCAGGLTAAFAFTPNSGDNPVKKMVAPKAYIYNLSTATGARDAANWTPVTGTAPSCGIAGSVPCKVVFDSSVYPTLQDYINDQGFSSDAEVAYGPGVVSKQ